MYFDKDIKQNLQNQSRLMDPKGTAYRYLPYPDTHYVCFSYAEYA